MFADPAQSVNPPASGRQVGSNTQQIGTPASVHEVLHSPGQDLPSDVRGFFEPRLGYDFRQVRVHTGDSAARAAHAIRARAFTVGEDIVFADRQFAPGTRDGRRLLGHELAHVVQQHRPETSPLGAADAERDARQAAARVADGRPATVQGGAAPGAVQKDDGASAATGGSDPVSGIPQAEATASGPATVVKIVAYAHNAGPAQAYLSDGSIKPVEVLTNNLGAGSYLFTPAGRPSGHLKDATQIIYTNKAFAWLQEVADSQAGGGLAVTVLIKDTSDQRFANLPGYIQAYLTRDVKGEPSLAEMQRLADAGEEMVRAGITEVDLALTQTPGAAIEVEDKAPPETDLVESLKRRGFSDFPSKEEYFKFLAQTTRTSSDFRRWWPDAATAAAYWEQFPDEASKEWTEFAEPLYQAAKRAEELSWLDAFRRIDTAAGVVKVIAAVTVIVAGGFTAAEIAALDIPAAIEAHTGIKFGLWAKAFFGATLSTGAIQAYISRSKEGSAEGTNPVSVASAAFLDAIGIGKVYQAVRGKSLLTGKDLHLSTEERVGSGLAGVLETGLNVLGLREFTGGGSPGFEEPTGTPAGGSPRFEESAGTPAGGSPRLEKPTGSPAELSGGPTPKAQLEASQDVAVRREGAAADQPAAATAAEHPAAPAATRSQALPAVTEAERVRMKEQGITDIRDAAAARAQKAKADLEAKAAEVAKAQELETAHEDVLAIEASGGGGKVSRPGRTGPATRTVKNDPVSGPSKSSAVTSTAPGPEGPVFQPGVTPTAKAVVRTLRGAGLNADRVARLGARFTSTDLQELGAYLKRTGRLLNDDGVNRLIDKVPPGGMADAVAQLERAAEQAAMRGEIVDTSAVGARVSGPRRAAEPWPQETPEHPWQIAQRQAEPVLEERFGQGWQNEPRINTVNPGKQLARTDPDWYNPRTEPPMTFEVKRLNLDDLGIEPKGRFRTEPSPASTEALARARVQLARREWNLPSPTQHNVLFNVTGQGVQDVLAVGRQLRALLQEFHIEYERVFVQDGTVLTEIPPAEIGD